MSLWVLVWLGVTVYVSKASLKDEYLSVKPCRFPHSQLSVKGLHQAQDHIFPPNFLLVSALFSPCKIFVSHSFIHSVIFTLTIHGASELPSYVKTRPWNGDEDGLSVLLFVSHPVWIKGCREQLIVECIVVAYCPHCLWLTGTCWCRQFILNIALCHSKWQLREIKLWKQVQKMSVSWSFIQRLRLCGRACYFKGWQNNSFHSRRTCPFCRQG